MGISYFAKKKNLTYITREWTSSTFNEKKLSFGWMPPHTSLFIKIKF